MISVVIRTKNQAKALTFLLENLITRYATDVAEIIVLDNNSTDSSKAITLQYGARYENATVFSYGGSANHAARLARHNIVVLFSAHSYPVSPDFFKVIAAKFQANSNLAGVRCLHAPNDYRNYINGITATQDPNKSGLIFSGSAFNKEVWKIIPFNEEVPTFEDKDWTKRVLKAGYDIDFAPVIFSYQINRNAKQLFFRYKNDLKGNYQIWHEEPRLSSALKGFFVSVWNIMKDSFVSLYYTIARLWYLIRFKMNKPKRFKY